MKKTMVIGLLMAIFGFSTMPAMAACSCKEKGAEKVEPAGEGKALGEKPSQETPQE